MKWLVLVLVLAAVAVTKASPLTDSSGGVCIDLTGKFEATDASQMLACSFPNGDCILQSSRVSGAKEWTPNVLYDNAICPNKDPAQGYYKYVGSMRHAFNLANTEADTKGEANIQTLYLNDAYSSLENYDIHISFNYMLTGSTSADTTLEIIMANGDTDTEEPTDVLKIVGHTEDVSDDCPWKSHNYLITDYVETQEIDLKFIVNPGTADTVFGIDNLCVYQVCKEHYELDSGTNKCVLKTYCEADSCAQDDETVDTSVGNNGCSEYTLDERQALPTDAPRFKCACAKGYINEPIGGDFGNLNTEICVDRNECSDTVGMLEGCDPNADITDVNDACYVFKQCLSEFHRDCSNTPGGFECVCKVGFEPQGSVLNTLAPGIMVSHCINVDECYLQTDTCDRHKTAEGHSGDRYKFATCEDVTPTESNGGIGFTCICDTNLYDDSNDLCRVPNICDDDSKCADVKHSTCIHSQASYECRCDAGYEPVPGTLPNDDVSNVKYNELKFIRKCQDTNECLVNLDICDSKARCVNTIGSYFCLCNNGYIGTYTKDNNERKCTDVNECTLKNDLCTDAHKVCRNTYGSYHCVCKPGFEADESGVCQDINECETSETILNNPCDREKSMTTCVNTVGGYECKCPAGYKVDYETGFDCIDIDECSDDNSCGDFSTCKNTDGSFECHCKPGYKLEDGTLVETDSTKCRDFRACSNVGSACNTNAFCVASTTLCQCNEHYEMVTDGLEYSCEARPPCDYLRAGCDQDNGFCTQTGVAATCHCKLGYKKDPTASQHCCIDVDECADNAHECVNEALCVNDKPGSYSCRCPKGFTGDGRANGCQPVSSCDCNEVSEDCHQLAGGRHRCTCKAGFKRNIFQKCIEIDNCKDNDRCGKNAICSNEVNDFVCLCKQDFAYFPEDSDDVLDDFTSEEADNGAHCQMIPHYSDKWMTETHCSASCGGGMKTIKQHCEMRKCRGPVAETREVPCNLQSCEEMTTVLKSLNCVVSHVLEDFTIFLKMKEQDDLLGMINEMDEMAPEEDCDFERFAEKTEELKAKMELVEKNYELVKFQRLVYLESLHCQRDQMNDFKRTVVESYKRIVVFLHRSREHLSKIKFMEMKLHNKSKVCHGPGWLTLDRFWDLTGEFFEKNQIE